MFFQLYKIFYSKQFGVKVEDIDVEFIILKQKVYNNPLGYKAKHIQRVVPPTGSTTMKKVLYDFNTFIDSVFIDGKYNTEREYIKVPNDSNCKYCPFNDNVDLCDKLVR